MAGLNSLLSLTKDALGAQSYGLDVTGQNVSNVNTPGYVRREAILQSRAAGTATYGGVDVKGLRRTFDQFVAGRYLDASGLSASADARDGALGNIEAIFNDAAGAGLGSSISALFASFQTLSTNPSDPSARAAVLSSATDFANKVRGASDAITTQRSELYSQAQGTTSEINDRAKQIAGLNQQISVAEAEGHDAADLKDKRDNLLDELSQRVDVHTFIDGQGQFVVRSAGTTLVEGSVAASLSVSIGSTGNLQIFAKQGSSGSVDVTSQVVGGSLGGIREARDVDAIAVMQKLDQFAYDVATKINGQHAAGVGLDGSTGLSLFSVSAAPQGAAASLTLDAGMVGHPEKLAAASSNASLPGGSDNAALLAGLASQPFASGATRTAAEAYSDIVGDVGSRKAGALRDAETRDAMKAQTKSMRDSTSGVSLDEEMVNLSRYQRAYEAATKLLQTVDQLMATLIGEIT
jgi:flagellar hook-associated protein 1 FlgK